MEILPRRSIRLSIPYYLVQVSVKGDDENESFFNVTGTELTLANPLWGARYSFRLTCLYRGLELDCGAHGVRAGVPEAPSECFEHGDGCPLAERVRFATPTRLRAAAMTNGSTMITWDDDRDHDEGGGSHRGRGGWRAPLTTLTLVDSKGRRVTVARGDHQVVAALEAEEEFSMMFTPTGDGIKKGRGVRTEATLVMSEFLRRCNYRIGISSPCLFLFCSVDRIEPASFLRLLRQP